MFIFEKFNFKNYIVSSQNCVVIFKLVNKNIYNCSCVCIYKISLLEIKMLYGKKYFLKLSKKLLFVLVLNILKCVYRIILSDFVHYYYAHTICFCNTSIIDRWYFPFWRFSEKGEKNRRQCDCDWECKRTSETHNWQIFTQSENMATRFSKDFG